MGALVWTGCNTQYPSSYLSSTGPNPSMVVNFESGLIINPSLAEANRLGNHVQTVGAINGNGSPNVTPLIVAPGANNTAHCVWINGSVFTPSTGNNYQAIQFGIPIESAGVTLNGAPVSVYDASLFTGIKFYLKVMNDDTAVVRSFSIPVLQTSIPPNGTCNQSAASNACYNGFAYAYGVTGGNWQLVSLPFSSMTRGNYGAAIVPPTLSGANLQQIVGLQWSEGGNNLPNTTVKVDFYVDEIQFF